MYKTGVVARRTIIICSECGYPYIIRKVDSRYCPFCRCERSDTENHLDAAIVKIGPLKEDFFRSLQDK